MNPNHKNKTLNPKSQNTSSKERTWAAITESNLNLADTHLVFESQLVGSEEIDIEIEENDEGLLEWQNSLIGFVPGLTSPLLGIQRFVTAKWTGAGCSSTHLLREGIFIFKFDSEAAMMDVMNKGPWHYYERPLVLQIWTPNLEIDATSIRSLPLWVKLPGLKLHLWTKKILSKLASTLGKPICCDVPTARMDRLDYARVCVEMNAGHKFPDLLTLNTPNGKLRQKVEYDWLPLKCSICNMFGHCESTCSSNTLKQVKPAQELRQDKAVKVAEKATKSSSKQAEEGTSSTSLNPASTRNKLTQDSNFPKDKGKAIMEHKEYQAPPKDQQKQISIKGIEILLKGPNDTAQLPQSSSDDESDEDTSFQTNLSHGDSSSFFAGLAGSDDQISPPQNNKKLSKRQKRKLRRGNNKSST